MVGKRKGFGRTPMIPHDIPLVLLGTGLLWFGWLGFNGGSALAANGLAANAFVVTFAAAAAGGTTWAVVEQLGHGKMTAVGFASGAVAGLVAITPASGFVGPLAALVFGFLASVASYQAIKLKSKLGYDDSLDVFGIHGVSGLLGAVLTGAFSSTAASMARMKTVFIGAPQIWPRKHHPFAAGQNQACRCQARRCDPFAWAEKYQAGPKPV
jgi:Amt family ammonium transporter